MGSSAGENIDGTTRRWLRLPGWLDDMLSDSIRVPIGVDGDVAAAEGLFDSPLVELLDVLEHDDETILRCLADAAKIVALAATSPTADIINPKTAHPSDNRASRLMVFITNLARMASLKVHAVRALASLHDGQSETTSVPSLWRGTRPPTGLDEWFEALEGALEEFSDAPFVPLELIAEWIREGGELLETPTLRLLDEIAVLRAATNSMDPRVFFGPYTEAKSATAATVHRPWGVEPSMLCGLDPSATSFISATKWDDVTCVDCLRMGCVMRAKTLEADAIRARSMAGMAETASPDIHDEEHPEDRIRTLSADLDAAERRVEALTNENHGLTGRLEQRTAQLAHSQRTSSAVLDAMFLITGRS